MKDNSFLANIATDLIKVYGNNMSNVAIIFPNKRAGIFMDEYLKHNLGDTPIWSPAYISISELVDTLCPVKQDDPIRTIFLLYNIYKKIAKKEDDEDFDINYFYTWGQQLMTDFNNIDKNAEDAQRILTNASDIWKLEKLDDDARERLKQIFNDTPCKDNSVKKNYQQLWENLYPIYVELNREMLQREEAYQGARYRMVVEGLETGTLQLPQQYDTYVFIGFNMLLKSERRIFEFIKKNKQTRYYWDCDKFFLDNDFKFCNTLKENLKAFPNAIKFEEQSHLEVKEDNINFIVASSSNGQAHYATQWLEQHLTDNENETAIVLCDEGQLQAVLHAIPSENDHLNKFVREINITKGFPLGNTPAYSEVNKYLKKKIQKETTNSEVILILENLASYLTSKARASINEHAAETWENILFAESYYQCYTTIIRFLSILKENIIEIKGFTAWTLLQQVLNSQTIPFKGEPATGLQVMGMLETRNLNFKQILMLNVNEGNVPKKSVDHSFLPYDLRKFYGLTTHEDESEVYAYNFFRLLQRCEHITYVFNGFGEQKSEKSRFLQQLKFTPDFNVKEFILKESLQSVVKKQEGVSKDEVLSFRQTKSKLSPSALIHFLECPMKYYFSDVAYLHEESKETDLLALNTLGSIFHDTMELCYKHLMHGKLIDAYGTPVSKEDIETLTDEQIDNFINTAYLQVSGADHYNSAINLEKYLKEHNNQAFLSHEERKKAGQEYISQHPDEALYKIENHPIETGIIKTYVKNTLHFDGKEENFHIVNMEKRYDTHIDEHFIGGYIDRLDMVNLNGKPTIRVVDYKTGKYDSGKMAGNMENIFSDISKKKYLFQTFIYCQAVLEHFTNEGTDLPIAPALIFPQKVNGSDYSPYLKLKDGSQEISVADYKAEVHTAFQERLQEVINSLDNTPYSLREEPECPNCPFCTLCNKKVSTF